MKMTNEFLDKLENHTDKLICPKGFLLCSQSRKTALKIASSLDHRPDLIPVLLKITYDESVPLAEVSRKDSTSLMVFDVYTVFRVKYVSRGQLSTVKIELADEDGKKLARMYRITHEKESIQNLLDQLSAPPKPPVRLTTLQQTTSPPPAIISNLSSLSVISEDDVDEEIQAEKLLERGEVDQALEIYHRLTPESARIFHTIGLLYAEKKGDYDSAIKYFKKALRIQEKVTSFSLYLIYFLFCISQVKMLRVHCHNWVLFIRIVMNLI
jgi:tetratricopeptide (TPR) repeat protein